MRRSSEKSTLTIYRKYKHSIKDEQNLYDNSAGTTTLFEARTGTLQLNDNKRHTNGETSCELCGYHYENCEHFLLHCTALQETRKNVIGLQQPFEESIDETISDFLLFKENSEEIVNTKTMVENDVETMHDELMMINYDYFFYQNSRLAPM